MQIDKDEFKFQGGEIPDIHDIRNIQDKINYPLKFLTPNDKRFSERLYKKINTAIMTLTSSQQSWDGPLAWNGPVARVKSVCHGG